jgi:small GTP-binding protein
VIRHKICLLGSFAVGKTSLVQRFVKGIFSEKYLTTLGVKIDKKKITIDDMEMEFIIWDLAGEDEFITVRESYLRGTAAYLLVIDGTRSETLKTALSLHQRIQKEDAPLPFVLLINKSDLKLQWNIDKEQIKQFKQAGWQIMETSAKNNEGVAESFQLLASALLHNNQRKK